MFSAVHKHYAGEIDKRNNHLGQKSLSACGVRVNQDVVVFISKTWPPFSKCFPSKLKRKVGVFKFLWFKTVFEKLYFRSELEWTAGLIGKFYAAFSNFSIITVDGACERYVKARAILGDFSNYVISLRDY